MSRKRRRSRVTSVKLCYEDAPSFSCTCHTLVKICSESGKIANEYCEHVKGNEIKEVGMLIYNSKWKVNKDAPYVYKEDDPNAVCTLHTPDTTEGTEPSTEPPKPTEVPVPTEPTPTEPPTTPTEPPTTPPASCRSPRASATRSSRRPA